MRRLRGERRRLSIDPGKCLFLPRQSVYTDDISRNRSSSSHAHTASILAKDKSGSYALSSTARIPRTTAVAVSNARRMATRTALQALGQVSLARDCVLVRTEHHTRTRSVSAKVETGSGPAGNVWAPAESVRLPLGFRVAAKTSVRRATCLVRPVSRSGGRSLNIIQISNPQTTSRLAVLSAAWTWTWTWTTTFSLYQAAHRRPLSPSQVAATLTSLQSCQLIHQATPAAPSRQCAPSSAIPCSSTTKTRPRTARIHVTSAPVHTLA